MSAQSATEQRLYSYIVTLSMAHAKKSNNWNYLVNFDGEQVEIATNKLVFYTKEPLTYEEVLKKIEGTKGVYNVEGDFYDD